MGHGELCGLTLEVCESGSRDVLCHGELCGLTLEFCESGPRDVLCHGELCGVTCWSFVGLRSCVCRLVL